MDVDNEGVSAEHRAADLLERLADLGGLDGGLTEEDLFARSNREPFRTLCVTLVARTQNEQARRLSRGRYIW